MTQMTDQGKLKRKLKMMAEFDIDPPVRAKRTVYDRDQPTGMAVASNKGMGGFPVGGKRDKVTRKLIR